MNLNDLIKLIVETSDSVEARTGISNPISRVFISDEDYWNIIDYSGHGALYGCGYEREVRDKIREQGNCDFTIYGVPINRVFSRKMKPEIVLNPKVYEYLLRRI